MISFKSFTDKLQDNLLERLAAGVRSFQAFLAVTFLIIFILTFLFLKLFSLFFQFFVLLIELFPHLFILLSKLLIENKELVSNMHVGYSFPVSRKYPKSANFVPLMIIINDIRLEKQALESFSTIYVVN